MGRLLLRTKRSNEVKEEVVVPQKHPLVQKVEDFNALRDDILCYMADHAEIVEPLLERFEMYNRALSDIESVMKTTPTLPEGLDKEFSRGTAAKTVYYTAEGLSAKVKAMPGVITAKVEVNRDVIEALLKSKVIDETDVAAARVEKVSNAPTKVPPKLELVFKRSTK